MGSPQHPHLGVYVSMVGVTALKISLGTLPALPLGLPHRFGFTLPRFSFQQCREKGNNKNLLGVQHSPMVQVPATAPISGSRPP